MDQLLSDAVDTGILVLSSKNLKQLPPSDSDEHDLSELTELDISRNRFVRVPDDVPTRLVELEKLNCFHNVISYVPDLRALQSLTVLNLGRNQLTQLPVHLCYLPLQTLNLSSNRLSAIPAEIKYLASLRELDVSNNTLETLPDELAAMAELRELHVSRNRLQSLPEDIGMMNLAMLDAAGNQITRLPLSLRLLKYLTGLEVDNNPLLMPPAHVCARGRVHIFKFLKDEHDKLQQDPSALADAVPMRVHQRKPDPKIRMSRALGALVNEAEIPDSPREAVFGDNAAIMKEEERLEMEDQQQQRLLVDRQRRAEEQQRRREEDERRANARAEMRKKMELEQRKREELLLEQKRKEEEKRVALAAAQQREDAIQQREQAVVLQRERAEQDMAQRERELRQRQLALEQKEQEHRRAQEERERAEKLRRQQDAERERQRQEQEVMARKQAELATRERAKAEALLVERERQMKAEIDRLEREKQLKEEEARQERLRREAEERKRKEKEQSLARGEEERRVLELKNRELESLRQAQAAKAAEPAPERSRLQTAPAAMLTGALAAARQEMLPHQQSGELTAAQAEQLERERLAIQRRLEAEKQQRDELLRQDEELQRQRAQQERQRAEEADRRAKADEARRQADEARRKEAAGLDNGRALGSVRAKPVSHEDKLAAMIAKQRAREEAAKRKKEEAAAEQERAQSDKLEAMERQKGEMVARIRARTSSNASRPGSSTATPTKVGSPKLRHSFSTPLGSPRGELPKPRARSSVRGTSSTAAVDAARERAEEEKRRIAEARRLDAEEDERRRLATEKAALERERAEAEKDRLARQAEIRRMEEEQRAMARQRQQQQQQQEQERKRQQQQQQERERLRLAKARQQQQQQQQQQRAAVTAARSPATSSASYTDPLVVAKNRQMRSKDEGQAVEQLRLEQVREARRQQVQAETRAAAASAQASAATAASDAGGMSEEDQKRAAFIAKQRAREQARKQKEREIRGSFGSQTRDHRAFASPSKGRAPGTTSSKATTATASSTTTTTTTNTVAAAPTSPRRSSYTRATHLQDTLGDGVALGAVSQSPAERDAAYVLSIQADKGRLKASANSHDQSVYNLMVAVEELSLDETGSVSRVGAQGTEMFMERVGKHVCGEKTVARLCRLLLEEIKLYEAGVQVLERVMGRAVPGLECPHDLASCVVDGVVLCDFVNTVSPGSVKTVNRGVPKGSLKARQNVEAFLEACRRLSISATRMCDSLSILQQRDTPTLIGVIEELAGDRARNLVSDV